MTITVVNSKGGASKSTVAFQVAGASFLEEKKEVLLLEFDDENKDSETFQNSKIKSQQVEVGDGTDIDLVLRETLLNNPNENLVLDVGGNKTTTILINGLKKSRLFRKIDLFIIPMSGGSQDLKNAERTYEMIKEFNIPVIFALSRVRNIKRLKFQYGDFFRLFPNHDYFTLTDSDVIDLSRSSKKSVFEIAFDDKTKQGFETALDKAFDSGDDEKIGQWSLLLQIYDESADYVKDVLVPAFKTIREALKVKDAKVKSDAK